MSLANTNSTQYLLSRLTYNINKCKSYPADECRRGNHEDGTGENTQGRYQWNTWNLTTKMLACDNTEPHQTIETLYRWY